MEKNEEEALREKYPKMLRDLGGDPKQTCMAWGFSHESGWRHLVESLCSYIAAITNAPWLVKRADGTGLVEVPSPVCIFRQVKEKFGGLRVYFDLDTSDISPDLLSSVNEDDYRDRTISLLNRISGAVGLAENMSHLICEKCGAPGKTYRNGWWRTLCKTHAAEEGKSESPVGPE